MYLGICELRLNCKQAMQGSASLACYTKDSKVTCSKYVLFRQYDKTLVATVHVPSAGAYCLSVFGKDFNDTSTSSTFLWNYFILSKTNSRLSTMLTFHEGVTYGHRPELLATGLHPKFNGDPLIITHEQELVLLFAYTNLMEMSFNLTYLSTGSSKARVDRYVICQTHEKEKMVCVFYYLLPVL